MQKRLMALAVLSFLTYTGFAGVNITLPGGTSSSGASAADVTNSLDLSVSPSLTNPVALAGRAIQYGYSTTWPQYRDTIIVSSDYPDWSGTYCWTNTISGATGGGWINKLNPVRGIWNNEGYYWLGYIDTLMPEWSGFSPDNFENESMGATSLPVCAFATWTPVAQSALTAVQPSALNGYVSTNTAPYKLLAASPLSLTYTGTNIITDASLSKMFRVTLTNDAQFTNVVNATDGQSLRWWIKQGTGTNLLSISSGYVLPTGTTNLVLSTKSNSVDLLIGEFDSGVSKVRLTGLLLFGE